MIMESSDKLYLGSSRPVGSGGGSGGADATSQLIVSNPTAESLSGTAPRQNAVNMELTASANAQQGKLNNHESRIETLEAGGGSGGVSDVKVDGTSVVTGGVANIATTDFLNKNSSDIQLIAPPIALDKDSALMGTDYNMQQHTIIATKTYNEGMNELTQIDIGSGTIHTNLKSSDRPSYEIGVFGDREDAAFLSDIEKKGVGGVFNEGMDFPAGGLQGFLDYEKSGREFTGLLVINTIAPYDNIDLNNVSTTSAIEFNIGAGAGIGAFNITNINGTIAINNHEGTDVGIFATNCNDISIDGAFFNSVTNNGSILKCSKSDGDALQLNRIENASNTSITIFTGNVFINEFVYNSGIYIVNNGIFIDWNDSETVANNYMIIDNRDGHDWDTFQRRIIPNPPESGTFTLQAVDGVIQWV